MPGHEVGAVARLSLRQCRRGIISWIVGLVALTILYSISYRSIAGVKAAAVNDYPASLKQALNLQDLTSPAGYLGSTAFGIPLLLLTTIFVIGFATTAIAGEEESGALDLMLAYPVGRSSVVLARMAVMMGALTTMGIVLDVVLFLLRGPTGLDVGSAELVATTVTWLFMGCCLGSIGLFLSAVLGRRSLTLGVSAAGALFAYLAGSFLPLVDGLRWIRLLSPYYWFDEGNPLSNGLQPGNCALLLAATVVFSFLAAAALNRRDIRV